MAYTRTREKEIVDKCVKALRALDPIRTVRVRKDVEVKGADERVDALIQVEGPWGTCNYLAEAKKQLTAATLQLIVHQLRRLQDRNAHPLLFAEYIPLNLAEELKSQRLEFVDTAGNAYLNHPPLYVEITGRKRPVKREIPQRAFRPAGLKLIYVLLKRPELIRTNYRDLAKRAGIAVGAVGTLLDNLRELGFIRRVKPEQHELANWRRLIDRWEIAYNEALRPKLALGTYRYVGQAVEDLAKAANDKEDVLIGGELAAAALTERIRPERATLHVAGDVARVLTLLRLLPDPKGTIDLLRTFGADNAYDRPGLTLADPLLIHVELLREPGERVREIADHLFEKYIVPRFQ